MLVSMQSCSKQIYTKEMIVNLEGLTVGNGITLHPKKPILLISKPIERTSQTGRKLYRIFELEYMNGKWCCEKEVAFSSKYTDYHPVFSTDGEWLYYNSDRPIPDSGKKSEKINVWRVKYNDGSWDNPEYLQQINTDGHESYPSLTAGGTLYFNSDRPGGKGSMDIYKSELVDGQFTKPESVAILNSKDSENDLSVDPKGRFVILNRYLFESKEIELFISGH